MSEEQACTSVSMQSKDRSTSKSLWAQRDTQKTEDRLASVIQSGVTPTL